MSAPPVRPLTDLLRLTAGPLVWFAHFTVIYGAEAIICTSSIAPAVVMRWTGGAATVLALAALVGLALASLRKGRSGEAQTGSAFLHGATLLLSILAMLAVIWTALPIAILSACTVPAG